jgi:hypothetical protein
MMLNFKHYCFFIFGILIFSCQSSQEKELSNEKDLIYDKINFFRIDSFDLRVEKFHSRFEKSNDFVLIDFENCSRCYGDNIDNFFKDLPKNEEITIIFNDSAVFFKYNSDFQNVLWNYVDAEQWKKMHLESSKILRYKRQNDKHLKRVN